MSGLRGRVRQLSAARRALLDVLLEEEEDVEQTGAEPVAVIGIGCRLPGAANSAEEFWANLSNKLDAISEIPTDRWRVDRYYDPSAGVPAKSNSRWGGFVSDIQGFDPAPFNISPREAIFIDPQQRMCLETAWHALESAGIPVESLAGSRTGVFLGIAQHDYSLVAATLAEDFPIHSPFSGTGAATSIAANRISYQLDLRGPSVSVDTACSSSLVAIHLACESLRRGESTLALAGGVNAILSPDVSVRFSNAGLLSPDGRCKAFDSRANGYVRGEGAGFIVLKLLEQAIADGDRIFCVIRGSAVNQDGRTNGLTAPSREAQEAVLRDAYQHAGLSPSQIQYIEAHGSGTAIGDPIEVGALGAVLAEGRRPDQVCALGSVKTNLGHLEAAAGIAGVIKTALAIHHRRLPASLHYETPNPYIPFESLCLRVQHEAGPWPREEEPLYAGVSSFSFGGTNAHIVLGDAPRRPRVETGHENPKPYVFTISAHTPEGLTALATGYRDVLLQTDAPFADVCYAASVRRSHLDHRLAIVGTSNAEIVERLEAHLLGEVHPTLHHATIRTGRPPVVFVFSGQGPQWWAMCRGLLSSEPVFRAAVERCSALIELAGGWSLLDELQKDEATSRLGETEIAQPAIFAVQVGLAALWAEWGVKPDAVIGHSVGEVAAAYVSGVLNFETAIRLVVARGKIMQQATGRGKMASVEVSYERARELASDWSGRVSVAASNARDAMVLSGEPQALACVLERLRSEGVHVKELPVNYAFHSDQLEGYGEELATALGKLDLSNAVVPIISTLTGTRESGATFDVSYWARQLRAPVLFHQGIEHLLKTAHECFVEIGPHPVLLPYIAATARDAGRTVTTVASLRRTDSDREVFLEAASILHCSGQQIAWSKQFERRREHVTLPLTPWRRERYWIGDLAGRRIPRVSTPNDPSRRSHPLLQKHIKLAFRSDVHLWETLITPGELPFVSDSTYDGKSVVPIGGLLALAIAAGVEAFGPQFGGLEEGVVESPVAVVEEGGVVVQVLIDHDATNRPRFVIASRHPDAGDEPWTLHARGSMSIGTQTPAATARSSKAEEIRRRCREMVAQSAVYADLESKGLTYTGGMQVLGPTWRRQEDASAEAFSEVVISPLLVPQLGAYQVHPALLEAIVQLLISTCGGAVHRDGIVAFDALRLMRIPVQNVSAIHVELLARDDASLARALLLDAEGRSLVELQGIRVEQSGLAKSHSPISTHQPKAPAGIRQQLVDAPPRKRMPIMEAFLREELSRSLRIPASRIARDVGFKRLGVESLMAVELRNRLQTILEIPISIGTMWGYPSIAQLAAFLLQELGMESARPASTRPPPADSTRTQQFYAAETRRMAALSDEETASLLEQELGSLPPTSRGKRS